MRNARTLNACTLAAAVVVALAGAAGADEISQSGFSPLYVGVDFETATIPSNRTSTGTPTTSRAYCAHRSLGTRDRARRHAA
jgi:hypothetical protein